MTSHLTVELQPSKLLFILLLIIYSGAIACLSLLFWPVWIKIIANLLCAWFGIQTIRQHATLSIAKSIIQIHYTDNQWFLQKKNNEQLTGRLLGNSFVSQSMLILNFKIENKRRKISIVLMPDHCKSKDLIRLRAFLEIK